MFRTCTHNDVASSLETIGAAFAIFESQPGGAVLISANSRFEDVTGQPVLECIGRPLDEFVPRYVERQMQACFGSCLSKLVSDETELIIEREASSRWFRLLVSPVLPDHDMHQRVIATLIEITEKKILQQKLEVSKERYAAVVETAYDGIITVDQNQRIKMMNEAARDVFGIAGDNVVGWHISRIIPERFRDNHARYFDSFRTSPVKVRPMQSRVPIFGLRTDGSEFEAEVTISRIKVGDATEMTAVVRDISERTKLIEQLRLAATQDPLTGIFNRRHGMAVLTSEINRCKRFGHEMTLVMFDLDRFKEINDNYGHACGDSVLISVVAAVSKTLRDADTLCRWGGEEFLVVLPETMLDDAIHWAERARDALATTVTACVGEQAVKITASFGLASLAGTDSTLEDLLKRVDDALYGAKENGRNQVRAKPGK